MAQEKSHSINMPQSPAEIFRTAAAFQRSRILLTAAELDLFSALEPQGDTPENVARRLETNPRATTRLMDVLAAMGFLDKENGKYSNSRIASDHLVKGKAGYLGGMMHLSHLWKTWSGLTDTVRSGEGAAPDPINDRSEEWLEAFINAMHSRGVARAKQVAPLIDFSGVHKMLDVGGGSGIFSATFIQQNPEMKSVVFDLPNVVPITRRYIERMNMNGNIDTMKGNYLDDPIGSGYDLIFLSAVIHSNSFAENAGLIRKCSAALKPGGRIEILDYVMDEDRTTPLAGAVFAINMLVGTAAGDTFTLGEISQWLTGAGLQDIRVKDAGEGSRLVSARLSN